MCELCYEEYHEGFKISIENTYGKNRIAKAFKNHFKDRRHRELWLPDEDLETVALLIDKERRIIKVGISQYNKYQYALEFLFGNRFNEYRLPGDNRAPKVEILDLGQRVKIGRNIVNSDFLYLEMLNSWRNINN